MFYNSSYSHRHIRRFCADYGMPITIVAASGLAYWGRFDPYVVVENMRLPTNAAFQPAGNREWLVRFWNLPGKYVGIAFPFGFVLFILFYFDANVSSLIAQGSEFPLRKPPGFHWDFFLLGITTFIAGLLGIPAPNGLIPQAPMHTAALVVMGRDKRDEETALQGEGAQSNDEKTPAKPEEVKEVPVSVVEQRVSNLAQGSIYCVKGAVKSETKGGGNVSFLLAALQLALLARSSTSTSLAIRHLGLDFAAAGRATARKAMHNPLMFDVE
ncbi:hypothetical protein QFC19_005773 [Naganishia cerealis]|uniref:Uncharacterized protein n=1 Tax=Naganishia cerealis TaxID=610337 RepID=A0ACC2VLQ1_9TREE|nr:hypothetical protein QFC19_005773 [Naganishia cerealis]